MPLPITVFGSIVHDLISYTDRFPRPGESVRGKAFQQGAGGKGANQAVAAALLGAKVKMIGKVGDDIFGDFNIDALKEAGVDTEGVEKCHGQSTATATICVAEDGENSIVVVLGANTSMAASTATQFEDAIKESSILLCQAEIDGAATKEAFRVARRHGVRTFYNPAPGDPSLGKDILHYVDIVCTNENEAEFITGINSATVEKAKEAATAMLDMGPSIAIVTLGPLGCIVAEKGKAVEHIEADKVKAVDSTGAGDCFCGSLAALLAWGEPIALTEAIRRASRIATLSVLKKGTQASYSTHKQIVDGGHGELVQSIGK